MTLPDDEHIGRPWRIHEIAPDFELEDVWAFHTPGAGPDDFPVMLAALRTAGGLDNNAPLVPASDRLPGTDQAMGTGLERTTRSSHQPDHQCRVTPASTTERQNRQSVASPASSSARSMSAASAGLAYGPRPFSAAST
jgi:hypothetical protein